MSQTSPLDEKAVLARVALGDLPTLDASYSFKSIFSDGNEVSHQVMSRIVDNKILKSPERRGLLWAFSGNAIIPIETIESPS